MLKLKEQINNQEMSFKEQIAPTTPALGYVRIYAKADGKMYRKDDAGVEVAMEGSAGSALKLSTLTVGATGADHTTIQGALDAIGVNGGKIYLTDASYTAPAGGFIIKGSNVMIEGNGNGTIINADGAVATTTFKANANTYVGFGLKNVTLNQTNATTQGVAIDGSAMSLNKIEGIKIVGFGTGIKLNDGGFNNTFYNNYKNISMFEVINGIDMTSTSPVNFNQFENIRVVVKAGSGGKALIMNNAQGNGYYNFNGEPLVATGITGIEMTTANTFDNNFYNVYLENNNIGLTLDVNTQRNNFYGGNIVVSATTNLSDLGKKNNFYAVNVGGVQVSKQASVQFVDTSNASEIAVDIKNNTSFAHIAGRLVRMLLLNGSDTSNVLEVGTAGSGLALQIQNTWATLRGANYSTVGVSNDTVFSNHSYIRMNGAVAQTLTGIAGGVDGKRLTLRNTTANTLTLNHESVLSIASNRILTPDALPYVVGAGKQVELIWDVSDSRWVVLAQHVVSTGGGSPAGSTTQVQYNNAGAFAGHSGMTYDSTVSALSVTGRVGVATPVYGGSRLGDSVLQAPSIDTQSLNIKDGLQNTLASWFATAGTGYVQSTLKSYLENDFTLRVVGKSHNLATTDGAAVLALINEDATGANVEGLDLFAQRYLTSGTDVAQTAGIIMLQEGTGAKLDFGFWYKNPGAQTYNRVYNISKTTYKMTFDQAPIIPGATSSADINLSGTNIGINLTGITTEPIAPATGVGRLYAKAIATRVMPKWIGPSGVDYPIQAHIGFNNIRGWRGGNTIVATTFASTEGTLPYTGASPIAPTIPALASTNILTQTSRSTISTSATAGTLAYIRANALNFWRGNGAGLGGFFVVHRFALTGTLQAGVRAFAGITDSVANPTNIDPLTSTTPGGVGLAVNANTGNWRLVNNITGTARTSLDLGASFPVTGAGMMELVLYSAPNGTGISYRVTNLSTGATTSGTLTTNIPSNTTFLNPVIWVTNNATAAAQTLDFISTYVETDY